MRETILRSASDQIMKYGLRGFTLDDITADLGISKKTLYKYITSKNELIREIIDTTVEVEKHTALKEMEKGHNWLEKLDALLSVYSYQAIPYRILDELHRYFPEERERIKEIGDFREHLAITLLEEGIQQGDIEPDVNPATITHALKKIFLTSTDPKLLEGLDMTVNQLLEQIKRLLIYGILKR